jgi:hypothetical protein
MARPSKRTPRQDDASPRPAQGPITLTWTLAELPSAQHRAGLAGLAMMVDYTRRLGLKPGETLAVSKIDEAMFTLEMDLGGLAALFERTYAAAYVQIERPRPFQKKRKDGSKVDVPPLERRQKEVVDAKGRTRTVEVCIYNTVEPHGGPLTDLVPAGDGGLWMKLWRNWIWTTLRAIPKQRMPYVVRAEGTVIADVEGEEDADGTEEVPTAGTLPRDVLTAWSQLASPRPVKQASTYYLGAMDSNAENVPFQDQGRFLFLLHFWPFAVQIFVPQTLDREGNTTTETNGFAVCIPEVARLATFLKIHERVLRGRTSDPAGFRPRQALVELAEAAAFQTDRWFHQQLQGQLASIQSRVTHGFQVIQTLKDGNSVRVLSNRTVTPTPHMRDAAAIVQDLWHAGVRRQVLENALEDRLPDRWWWGFDRICATTPRSQTLDSSRFRHDARILFEHFHPTPSKEAPMADPDREPRALEQIILHMVTTWISSRLESKYQLLWTTVKGTPRAAEYEEKRSKLAAEAFLAARSRPGQDFTQWFTTTLCSVNQRLAEKEYVLLSRALEQRPDQVRAMTLLALSARG